MLVKLVVDDKGGVLDFYIVGGEEFAVPLQLEEDEVAVERRYAACQCSAGLGWDEVKG